MCCVPRAGLEKVAVACPTDRARDHEQRDRNMKALEQRLAGRPLTFCLRPEGSGFSVSPQCSEPGSLAAQSVLAGEIPPRRDAAWGTA